MRREGGHQGWRYADVASALASKSAAIFIRASAEQGFYERRIDAQSLASGLSVT